MFTKGLAQISQQERKEIEQRWMPLQKKNLFENRYFWFGLLTLLLGLSIIIIVISIWNASLKKAVKEKTKALEVSTQELLYKTYHDELTGLYNRVYFSEILRGAYNFINKKQILIANSLGISKFKLYKDIIIPQLLKKGKNPLIKQSIICFNESSLVYIIGINDFFGVAVKIGEQNQSIGTSLLLVSIVYITISLIYQKLILKNK